MCPEWAVADDDSGLRGMPQTVATAWLLHTRRETVDDDKLEYA